MTKRHILITGPPAVGKTTLVKSVVNKLRTEHSCSGFYTEEVREQGRRIGFDVVTLEGARSALARIGGADGPAVGQYRVDVVGFERTALPCLQTVGRLVVIDEIGRMELFSDKFQHTVRRLMDADSVVVMATVPVPKPGQPALLSEIRARCDVELVEVSKQNRASKVPQVASRLTQLVQQLT